MNLVVRALLCVAVMLGNLSCSQNVLEIFADKNTNEAFLVNAKKLMNDSDFDGALEQIALMTDEFEATRSVVYLKASAYAGRCGLRFLPLVEALGNLGTSRLFPVLLSAFRSGLTVSSIDDCRTAEDLVESIGAISTRTADENLLLLTISFAKMGVIMSYYGDNDQDGTVDGGFDVCADGAGARTFGADISDADIREFGTGLTLAIANITALTGTIDLGTSSLTAIADACADLAAIPPAGTYDFCSVTNPASFTTEHLQAIRSLLKEDSVVGLDSMGCDGDVSLCECIP